MCIITYLLRSSGLRGFIYTRVALPSTSARAVLAALFRIDIPSGNPSPFALSFLPLEAGESKELFLITYSSRLTRDPSLLAFYFLSDTWADKQLGFSFVFEVTSAVKLLFFKNNVYYYSTPRLFLLNLLF